MLEETDPFEHELFDDHMIFSSLPQTPDLGLKMEAPAETPRRPRRKRPKARSENSPNNEDEHDIEEEYEEDEEVEAEEDMIKSPSKSSFTAHWLMSNYELREGVSIPRSLLFGQYLDTCQRQAVEPVNAATFGKIIRAVWPTVATRRLGTRGNSKYHYYGITLKRSKSHHMGASAPVRFVPIPPPVPRKPHTRRIPQLSPPPSMMPSVENTNISNLNIQKSPQFNNEAFILAMANICTPNAQALPPQIPFEAVCQFATVYQQHLLHLQQAALSLEFQQVYALT